MEPKLFPSFNAFTGTIFQDDNAHLNTVRNIKKVSVHHKHGSFHCIRYFAEHLNRSEISGVSKSTVTRTE